MNNYFKSNNNNSSGNLLLLFILLILVVCIIKYLKLNKPQSYCSFGSQGTHNNHNCKNNTLCNGNNYGYKPNEYYNPPSVQKKTLKAANPGYGKIVSTDDNGSLGTFEFPKGIIVAWSGDITKIPDGWTLCDGTNGAPDLRGRFIMGTNPNSNKNADFTVREMQTKGGEETHKLTIGEIPSHNHTWCHGGGGGASLEESLNGGKIGTGFSNSNIIRSNIDSNCQYSKVRTNSVGEDKPHNILPPYITLAYIMKL